MVFVGFSFLQIGCGYIDPHAKPAQRQCSKQHHRSSGQWSKVALPCRYADLIKAVKPQVAMSTGAIIMEPDIYSHYAREGTAVYMDVYDGYVKVAMDGTNVSTETSRDRGEIAVYDKFDKAFHIVRD